MYKTEECENKIHYAYRIKQMAHLDCIEEEMELEDDSGLEDQMSSPSNYHHQVTMEMDDLLDDDDGGANESIWNNTCSSGANVFHHTERDETADTKPSKEGTLDWEDSELIAPKIFHYLNFSSSAEANTLKGPEGTAKLNKSSRKRSSHQYLDGEPSPKTFRYSDPNIFHEYNIKR